MKSKNNIDFGYLTSSPMINQMRRTNQKDINMQHISSKSQSKNSNSQFSSSGKEFSKDKSHRFNCPNMNEVDNYSFGKSSLDDVCEENDDMSPKQIMQIKAKYSE